MYKIIKNKKKGVSYCFSLLIDKRNWALPLGIAFYINTVTIHFLLFHFEIEVFNYDAPEDKDNIIKNNIRI